MVNSKTGTKKTKQQIPFREEEEGKKKEIQCRQFPGTISSVTLSQWNSSGAVLQPCVLPQWNTDREQLAVRHPGTLAVQIFDSFLAALSP